jgi:hypothetical protein
VIVDMGLYFDGRCACCGDWIGLEGDPYYTRGRGHGIEHALCSIYTLPDAVLPPQTLEVEARQTVAA